MVTIRHICCISKTYCCLCHNIWQRVLLFQQCLASGMPSICLTWTCNFVFLIYLSCDLYCAIFDSAKQALCDKTIGLWGIFADLNLLTLLALLWANSLQGGHVWDLKYGEYVWYLMKLLDWPLVWIAIIGNDCGGPEDNFLRAKCFLVFGGAF